MSNESTDEMAWRLAWASQWRLQQESRHIEPTLEKMIGHLSVFNHTSEYVQTHEVSSGAASPDIGVGHVEDIALGADWDEGDSVGERASLLAPVAKNDSRPKLVRSAAVVVTAVEIDDDDEEAHGDPFSDEEAASSHGDEHDNDDEDDDYGWSSDEENEFDSVSSVEDESGSEDALLASKLSTIHEEEIERGAETP